MTRRVRTGGGVERPVEGGGGYGRSVVGTRSAGCCGHVESSGSTPLPQKTPRYSVRPSVSHPLPGQPAASISPMKEGRPRGARQDGGASSVATRRGAARCSTGRARWSPDTSGRRCRGWQWKSETLAVRMGASRWNGGEGGEEPRVWSTCAKCEDVIGCAVGAEAPRSP